MELEIIFRVFIGSIGVTFLAWLIVHFNGKTLLGIFDLVFALISPKNKLNESSRTWLAVAKEAEVILLGITPLAIASLISTTGGNCFNSIQTLIVTEVIILGFFLLIPNPLKLTNNFWGEQFYAPRWSVFLMAIVWCLIFSIWGYLAIDPAVNQGIDRLLVNGNGDMWFYVRRFAAYTVNNISFDNQPACHYLQISPKKLSSFIGSVIVYGSPNTVFGITLFQGLLGCSLFLALFGNWEDFNYQGQKLSKKASVWAILWALFSPPIFWLVITSYLSNALFITIFILGLTAARRVCLNQDKYIFYATPILLFSFILNVFSFYIVLLPVALSFYLVTILIYQYEQYLQPKQGLANVAKLMLATGISILACCLLFNHQINLTEVAGSLNALKEHGKNFVPLNPWSLVQEKPNPMPNIKDFGVWFNIIVGTIFSVLVLRTVCQNIIALKNSKQINHIYLKDLIAAALVLGIYLLYFLAYIPLEYTYRLGKFAVSILFPLATVATLPLVLWFRDHFYRHKSRLFHFGCLVLLVIHIILHIDKTLYLKAQPAGKYNLISTDRIENSASLTIVRCLNSSVSQKYQKILGLDLAKNHPNLAINVITTKSLMDNFPATEIVLYGEDVVGEDKNLCIYEIKL
ncbi:MAG: hypothetical protein AAF298_06040 [Cyanobacteria bacterium P01_A01_bin.40]